MMKSCGIKVPFNKYVTMILVILTPFLCIKSQRGMSRYSAPLPPLSVTSLLNGPNWF